MVYASSSFLTPEHTYIHNKSPMAAIMIASFILLFPSLSLAGAPAVLITGASSGIGLRTTQLLSTSGYYVYAGARKKTDRDALNKMPNVEAVRLDVTVQADIDAAVGQIRARGRELHGVVKKTPVLHFWGR